MKKLVFTLFVTFMFAAMGAQAQIIDSFTDAHFEEQAPLAERDIKAFINGLEAFGYIIKVVEDEEAGKVTNIKTVDANVQRISGLSLERYIFVMSKITTVSAIMFDYDDETAEEIYKQLPEYLRPTSIEKLLINRYKADLQRTLTEMEGY